jgi:hypothetical protein
MSRDGSPPLLLENAGCAELDMTVLFKKIPWSQPSEEHCLFFFISTIASFTGPEWCDVDVLDEANLGTDSIHKRF